MIAVILGLAIGIQNAAHGRSSTIGADSFQDVPLRSATSLDIPCPADTDADGAVNVDDLLNVILCWGTDGSACNADIAGGDSAGIVDVDDLVAVIEQWGYCPVINDQCAGAELILFPGSYPFTTLGTIIDFACFACAAPGMSGGDVFFRHIPGSDAAELTIDTAGSDPQFNTVLEVYAIDGSPCADLTLLACDNDALGPHLHSQVVLRDVAAGTQLLIRVGGDSFGAPAFAAEGVGVLNVRHSRHSK